MPTYTGSNSSEVYLGTSSDDVVRNIGVGLDVVTTGAGDDIVYVVPDDGGLLDILPDIISMGSGDDTLVIDYSGSDQAVETSRPLLDLSTGGLAASVSLAGLESLTFSGVEHLQVMGGSANDTIRVAGDDQASGGAGNDTLEGGAGNNVLNGGQGIDTMSGGTGDDTYYVDNGADQVIELRGEGTDTVYSSATYSLRGQYIENLTLTGSADINGRGNTLDNVLRGNSGDNVLNGTSGSDLFYGGQGDDTYYVNSSRDKAYEVADAGRDTVYSSVDYSLRGQHIETLILTGSANIDGRGNTLANRIEGNGGNNVIDGGAGVDTLIGGKGNDTFYVDNSRDTVIELRGGGVDQVFSSADYDLKGSYIQKLTLTGSGDLNARGNGIANTLIGNSGDNRLDGERGADVLQGGGGSDELTGGTNADVFLYTKVSDSTLSSSDTITDLRNNDRIDLSRIDADIHASGDQAFRLVDEFTDVAGQMTIDYSTSTRTTTIQMDVNGDGLADMCIMVSGNHDDYTNFVF